MFKLVFGWCWLCLGLPFGLVVLVFGFRDYVALLTACVYCYLVVTISA